MKMLLRLALGAAVATAVLPGPVLAQGTGQGLVGTYCKAEIAKFCPNVPHQRGAVPACLEQHQAELSDDCRQALASKGPGWGQGRGMGGMGMGGMGSMAQ